MSNPNLQSETERGFVLVFYALGEQAFPAPNPDLRWKMAKLQEALPVKIVAVHLCKDKSVHNQMFAYLMMAFNAFTRIRIRMHYGEFTGRVAELSKFQ